MFDGYCKLIMQPKKISYNRTDLECGVPRRDFILQGLQCSLYKCNKYTQTCVLYLHGYNGSRLEAVPYAQQVCKYDMDFCSFDFQAAGLSEGDIVTFGIKEEENVGVLVSYLRDQYQHIILWGRSMGATTAIMYTLRNQNIKSLVLDSPFITLDDVILNLIKQKLHTPDIINKGLYELISRQIINKYQFRIDKIQLPQIIKIDCPMLLLASKQDNLIPYHHFTQLMKSYSGSKRMVQLQCNHNEQRPRDIIQTVLGFIFSMSPKTKFSPTRYPHRLVGDMEQHQYIASGTKIKQKIMRNNSTSTHSKNSAQIQKDRALFQLSNVK